MRPKGLIAIAVAACLVLLLAANWYAVRPARVRAYYVTLFAQAQTITISRSAHLSSVLPAKSRILRRRDDLDLFALLEDSVRNGSVQNHPCQCVISWQLAVTDRGGRTAQVKVAHYLFSDDQPYAGSLWFYPVHGGDTGLIGEFDALMAVKAASPSPVPAAK